MWLHMLADKRRWKGESKILKKKKKTAKYLSSLTLKNS